MSGTSFGMRGTLPAASASAATVDQIGADQVTAVFRAVTLGVVAATAGAVLLKRHALSARPRNRVDSNSVVRLHSCLFGSAYRAPAPL
jgi:hypothetical protein